ncbi:MAG: polysulfide reductase NrfD [Planctomycetes bacterium]|nr:polysulfide reductase NrfD [Planctomycetota bacterium]
MTTITVIDEAENPLHRAPLVENGRTFAEVTDLVARPAERRTPPSWYMGLGISIAILLNLGAMIGYLVFTGVGVWGNNSPVGWGWPIVNFVFWIGIGHAGTLISAILFLFRQKWRTSINRAAEAMTIFAVMAAGIFPAIHVGRIWVIYWVFPVPNQMAMWPNFKSPLLWDVFAVSTYFTVSALFWYVGLIPDLATFRDRAVKTGRMIAARIYGLFAFGWHGSNRHWLHYEKAYLILAGLSTPLVLSVHSIVSFDFAVSLLPGWHTTIFPPYFVAGAIFSGFGMVLTLMIPARSWLGLRDLITLNHLDNIAKILLLTGTMVGYAYSMEFFIAWYSGVAYEKYAFLNRAFGPYYWAYWTMIFCNVVTPQLFWFRKCRRTPWILFTASIFVNIGMWFERFVITVTSLHRDFLPSSWDYFTPTIIDVLTYLGSFGLFFTMFLLFCKFLPVIAISEVKGVMPEANPHHGDTHHAPGQHGHAAQGHVAQGGVH